MNIFVSISSLSLNMACLKVIQCQKPSFRANKQKTLLTLQRSLFRPNLVILNSFSIQIKSGIIYMTLWSLLNFMLQLKVSYIEPSWPSCFYLVTRLCRGISQRGCYINNQIAQWSYYLYTIHCYRCSIYNPPIARHC